MLGGVKGQVNEGEISDQAEVLERFWCINPEGAQV
jgi:hypothetical protein